MGDLVVRPTSELGQRMVEHGRIRMGVKTAKGAPKAIDVWRFTSPDAEAIRQLAVLYGGNARPWNDPRANPQDQWEVITTSKAVRVFIPPGGLSLWYELWSGGGCQRRCDGETCTLPAIENSGEQKCLCVRNNNFECRPHTRLNVIIPEVPFGGVWRLESHGWAAAQELPAMEAALQQLQFSSQAIVEGMLKIEKAQSQGGRRQYVVPRLSLSSTPEQILAGEANLRGLAPASPPAPALGPGQAGPGSDQPSVPAGAGPGPANLDDDIVDAEIVDEPKAPGSNPGDVGAASNGPVVQGTGTDHPQAQSLTKIEKRLVILCNQAAERNEIDPDLFRHALANKVSKGRVQSSRSLTDAERDEAIDVATQIADGDRQCKVQSTDPPIIKISLPN